MNSLPGISDEARSGLEAIASELGCSESVALERAVGMLKIAVEHLAMPGASIALRAPGQLDVFVEPGLLRRRVCRKGEPQ
jgi:hypothetical protein